MVWVTVYFPVSLFEDEEKAVEGAKAQAKQTNMIVGVAEMTKLVDPAGNISKIEGVVKPTPPS